MHIMEPPDLWERYIAPEYRSQAPRGVTSENVRDLRLNPAGHDAAQRRARRAGSNYERNQTLYADHARRGWLPEVPARGDGHRRYRRRRDVPEPRLVALTQPEHGAAATRRRSRARITTGSTTSVKVDPARMFGAGMLSVYRHRPRRRRSPPRRRRARVQGDVSARRTWSTANRGTIRTTSRFGRRSRSSTSRSDSTKRPDRGRVRPATTSSPTSG